ncbi:MAG: carboxypeptidase regulatory-like domain-containing protein [Acidobacteriia bacterium]|nr:carboxypeptidase regulatory-like domain-containing protein [Terriglobia bacterium]
MKFFIGLVMSAAMFAQSAQVTGRVIDASNAVMPGVTVTVRNAATSAQRVVTSNDLGLYTIPLLQPGTYDVSVKRDGFKPVSQNGVVLVVDQRAELNFTMQVGALTEQEGRGEPAQFGGSLAGAGDRQPADRGDAAQWAQLHRSSADVGRRGAIGARFADRGIFGRWTESQPEQLHHGRGGQQLGGVGRGGPAGGNGGAFNRRDPGIQGANQRLRGRVRTRDGRGGESDH